MGRRDKTTTPICSSCGSSTMMRDRAWLHDHYTCLNNSPPPCTGGTHGYPQSVIRVCPMTSSPKPPLPLPQRPAQCRTHPTGNEPWGGGQQHRRMQWHGPAEGIFCPGPWMPTFIQQRSSPTPLQYCMTRPPSCLQANLTGVMQSHVGWGASISGNRVARGDTHRFLRGIGVKAFRRSAREAMPPTSTWRDDDRHHWPRPSRDS